MTDLLPRDLAPSLPPMLQGAADLLAQDQAFKAREQAGRALAAIAPEEQDQLFAAHLLMLDASRRLHDSQAVRHGLELVMLAERAGRDDLRCLAHHELADAYRQLGAHERAVAHLRESLRFASMDDAAQSARPFLSLGLAYLDLERPADALACLERARNSFLHLGESGEAGQALMGEAQALLALGQYAEAVNRLERAEAGFRLADLSGRLPAVYRLMARAAAMQGAVAQANSHFRLAMKLHAQGHGAEAEADTRLEYAAFQLECGDPYGARVNLEQALELYRMRGNLVGQAGAVRLLGEVHERSGDAAAALASLKEHLELRGELETRGGEREAAIRIMQLEQSLQREHTSTRRTQQALVEANRVLRDQSARLEELSRTDHLTGLYNRRYLTGFLESRYERDTTRAGLSLVLMDLDDFKAVNDRYGHAVGDQVLVRVAELFMGTFRSEDIVARWGGEEFAVAMPALGCSEATAIADRVCQDIENHDWSRLGDGLKVTVSVGVTCAREAGAGGLGELLRLADQRLYEAKRGGRNRVIGGK